jgi:hypothetical protein
VESLGLCDYISLFKAFHLLEQQDESDVTLYFFRNDFLGNTSLIAWLLALVLLTEPVNQLISVVAVTTIAAL